MSGMTRRQVVLGTLGAALGTTALPFLAVAPALQGDGHELVVADASAPPPSLDPFKVYGTQAQSLFRLIYSPLFDRAPDGKLVAPFLERWGQADAVTWEFRLRPGVRFQDGGELTAADVVYSLKRIVDPEVQSPRRHEFEEFEAIVALDPRTFRVVTKRPYALLPARLSQFSMLLPERLRDRPEAEFFQRPVGLGSFRLAEINVEQAVLLAFPEHFSGPPGVPRITFRFIASPGERFQRLLAGSVDVVTNLPPQQVDAIMRARAVHLMKRHSTRFMNIMFDTTHGPLARLPARQALRHGTDLDGLVKYVARGNGRPLACPVLPEDFGFNADLRPYPFDPGKARALLTQSGYPDGFRLRGLATYDTRIVATAVARQWAKLGVNLALTVEGRAQATERWIREPGLHDVRFLDPTSIIYDASYQLRLHVDPKHPVARSPHPRGLELLNRSDEERDPDARAALLREVQVIVYDQALGLPLYQVVDLYGVGNRVHGFVPSADTILRLASVTVTP